MSSRFLDKLQRIAEGAKAMQLAPTDLLPASAVRPLGGGTHSADDYRRDPFLGLDARGRREAARIADRGGRGKLLKKYGPFQGAALADHFGLTRRQDALERQARARAPVSAREAATMVALNATRRGKDGA